MKTHHELVTHVSGIEFKAHKILSPDVDALRDTVAEVFGSIKFPGPLPVSMERKDVPKVLDRDYLVCEKTDGHRFLFFCVRYQGLKIVALMDRKFEMYLLPIRRVPRALFQGTFCDAELALDKSSLKLTLLVFDAMVVSGVRVSHLDMYARIDAIKKGLAGYQHVEQDPAVVAVKGFVPLRATHLIRDHLRTVQGSFDVDGVVLSPAGEPVRFGRHPGMFKLKDTHTVDFWVHGGRLHVWDPRAKRNVDVGRTLDAVADGCVAECYMDWQGEWRVKLVRTDKHTANDTLTYEKTLINIEESLGIEEILRAIESRQRN